MAKSKALATTAKNTAIQPLQPWEEEAAKEARDEKSREVLGLPRITHQAGQLKLDDKPVVGNKLSLIVVDYKFANQWFAEKFQPGVAATPACYAFGNEEAGMAPHPAAPKPQATSCAICPKNVFGTAEMGRGKACQNTRRLLVVVPPKNADAFNKTEKRQISVPAGSLKNFGNLLGSLRDTTRTGNIREAIVEVGTEPKGGAYALTFTQTGTLPPDQFQAVLALRKASEGLLTQPFPTLDSGEAEKAPVKGMSKNSKRKLD